MKKCQHLFLLFLKNFLFFLFFFNFPLFSLNAEFFFANYERTLPAYFQFAQMDLARATLELIRVLRTLINSSAKNLHKLPICLRFYSFYNKLDIQVILFDFFYFPINAPGIPEAAPPARPGRGSAWWGATGGSVAERNGEKTGDGKTSGQKEGGGCGGRTRGAEQ